MTSPCLFRTEKEHAYVQGVHACQVAIVPMIGYLPRPLRSTGQQWQLSVGSQRPDMMSPFLF